MPSIIDPSPQSGSALPVRLNQPVRMVASGNADWYVRQNSSTWPGTPTLSNQPVFVWTPTSVAQLLTFDVYDVGVSTVGGGTPSVVALSFNVCAGPVALPQVASRVRDKSMTEPPFNPDALESDDPPLGFPLAMPGASRDGLGTVRLVVLSVIPDRQSLDIGREMTSSKTSGASRHLEDVCSNRMATTS